MLLHIAKFQSTSSFSSIHLSTLSSRFRCSRTFSLASLRSRPALHFYSTSTKKPSLFSKYYDQFRSKPSSYVISFLLLHEITAIVPIPLVYLALDYTGIQVPLPENMLQEGNKRINAMLRYFGFSEVEQGSRVAFLAASSYGIVKVCIERLWAIFRKRLLRLFSPRC